MSKYYVVERNFDVEVYTNKDAAFNDIDYHWSRLTDSEKEKAEYFRCYEIETDKNVDDIADLADYMTEVVVDYIK